MAGSLCGIEPVAASEVEPYPIAVTRSRFPGMKHLGNVSNINGAEIEPVNVITFGSPCQDLSVAGKRAGIKHEATGDEETTRSGLFMEAVRIIKEMRTATNGVYPNVILWENVPGAFSSNSGNDFRIVLEELIKIVEPDAVMPPVPKAGWAYADSYTGDGWSLAYRVFDAQYWGVPQRRRRIHLVLDLRGQRARKILFERDGLRGYFEAGRTPWQATPRNAKNGLGADDREGEGNRIAIGFSMYNQQSTGHVSQTIKTPVGGDDIPVVCYPKPIHDQATRFSGKRGDKSDGKGNGLGIGDPGDPMNALTSGDRHAVAFQTYQKVTGPLMANSHPGSYTGQDAFSDMLVAGMDCRNGALNGDLCGTLQAKPNGGFSYNCIHPVIVKTPAQYIVRRLTPTECARLQGFADTWGIPDQKNSFTDDEYLFWLDVRNTHAEINGKAVKEYTKEQMLKWYNKLHTDSAEYKMWGNGIALPPALYCMQGIVDALNEEAGM